MDTPSTKMKVGDIWYCDVVEEHFLIMDKLEKHYRIHGETSPGFIITIRWLDNWEEDEISIDQLGESTRFVFYS